MFLIQVLMTMLAAGAASCVAADLFGRAAARRMLPASRESLAVRKQFLAFAVGYTLFIVYGSVLPFQYSPISPGAALERLEQAPYLRLGAGQERADWIATILFVAPAGFFWTGCFCVGDRTPWFRWLCGILAGVGGSLFAVAVEYLQVWFPPRTISLNDIFAAAGGAWVGAIGWLLVGELLFAAWRKLSDVRTWAGKIDWLLALYAAGLAIYCVLPLDIVLSRVEFLQKMREGRIQLTPFSAVLAGRVAWYTLIVPIAAWLPVGFLARHWGGPGPRSGIAVLGAAALAFLVEFLRLLVFTRVASTTQLLMAWLGIVIGWYVCYHGPEIERLRRESRIGKALTSSSSPWLIAMLVYSAALLGAMAWAGDFNGHPRWTSPRLIGMARMPFASLYWDSKFGALSSVARKTLIYVPLGVCMAISWRAVGARGAKRWWFAALGVVAVAAVGALGELIQVFQLSRLPDSTDVLLAAFAGAAGLWIIARLPPAPVRRETRMASSVATFGLLLLAMLGAYGWAGQRHWRWSQMHHSSEALLSLASDDTPIEPADTASEAERAQRSLTAQYRYGSELSNPFAAPRFVPIDLPRFEGALALWGATGRAEDGHLWFGVSTTGGGVAARLWELDPETAQIEDRGDPIATLRTAGKLRAGAGQNKIHSRIVVGGDGNLYFASMDEQGEDDATEKPPIWGSHLWRLKLPERRWEHLFAAPEGLIAVAGAGDWIYSLGYYGHILYQYHIPSQRVRKVRVGSEGGHISRNLLCDARGHVYVPRFELDTKSPLGARVQLVELDARLTELAATELFNYTLATPKESHGIVSFQMLADRSLVFATDSGFLYRIVPAESGPARVEELDWFHPGGSAYVATMFTRDGERYLYGVGKSSSRRERRYEWLVFDLQECVARAIEIPAKDPIHNAIYIYGSVTRDNQGRMYVVGGGEVATWRVSPDLERAVRAVGGSAADLKALRDASHPTNGPAIFRVEFDE